MGRINSPKRAFVVGVTGGVASGKSSVARMFGELGARVLDADAMAKEALREPGVKAAISCVFGPGVLDDFGEVDRKALAEAAFGPPPRTLELNKIVHPRVAEQLREASRQGGGAIVFDAPLLLEAGLETECDLVVHVDAPESVRRARAAGRGWTIDEWRRREACQAPASEKRRRAGAVVDNGGSPAAAREQVETIYRTLVLPGIDAGGAGKSAPRGKGRAGK